MADTHFLQVRAGRADPPSLELRPGVELTPLSVGSGGAWQVTAPGVLVVHLYIYFDGQTLYVQSADESDPVGIDDEPVPNTWTEVPHECRITFGLAELLFRPAGSDDREDEAPQEDPTVAEPIPDVLREGGDRDKTTAAPRRPELPTRPFAPGAFAAQPDGESTRLAPLEDLAGPTGDPTLVSPLQGGGGGGGTAPVRPAAGAPWTRAATQPAIDASAAAGGAPRPFPPAPLSAPEPPTYSEQQRQLGAPRNGPPSGLLNIAPPSVRKPEAPETFEEKMKRQWAATPPLRRALIGATPLALIILAWATFSGSPPPPPPPKNLVASAPSTTTGASSGIPTAAVSPTTAPTPWPPLPPPPPPAPPPPVIAGGTAQPPQGTTAQSQASTAQPALPSPLTGDGGAPNVDRRERQAADFVSTHAYDQAIRIYEALALERPQNPAYHEAARILRNKIETNTP